MKKEYKVTVKVQNNLLIAAIKEAGFDSVRSFSIASCLSYSALIGLINLKEAPLEGSGEVRPFVVKLLAALNKELDELFTLEQCMSLEKNVTEYEIGYSEIEKFLPNYDPIRSIEKEDAREAMEKSLSFLGDYDERELGVLKMRYGFEGEPKTLQEVAELYGVTKERIRQIEARALRKLRHPDRNMSTLAIEHFDYDFKYNRRETV